MNGSVKTRWGINRAGGRVAASLVLVLTAAGTCTGPLAADLETVGLPRVHDPSTIVRCGDDYWLFCTGTGVPSRRSKDLVSWTPGPPVFDAVPAWIAAFLPGHRGHLWAPDLVALRGRYFLYYSVSTWGKNTSAIALAANATLDPDHPAFGWKDEGIVIQSAATNDFNANHFYDGERRGAHTLGIRRLDWDDAGWPCAGEPISP